MNLINFVIVNKYDEFKALLSPDEVTGHRSDDTFKALGKMGYSGTLNDRLFAYYKDRDFPSLVEGLSADYHKIVGSRKPQEPQEPIFETEFSTINFQGKVRGDGDNHRIMRFGNAPHLTLPDLFANEVGAGYSGVSFENDGSTALWVIGSPLGHYSQFAMYFKLDRFGSLQSNLENIKSIKLYIRVIDSTVFYFDTAWRQIERVEGNGVVELTFKGDQLQNLLNSRGINEIYFGVMANQISASGISSRAEIDFVELTVETIKN